MILWVLGVFINLPKINYGDFPQKITKNKIFKNWKGGKKVDFRWSRNGFEGKHQDIFHSTI